MPTTWLTKLKGVAIAIGGVLVLLTVVTVFAASNSSGDSYPGGDAPDGSHCDYGYNPETKACCDEDDYSCEQHDQGLTTPSPDPSPIVASPAQTETSTPPPETPPAPDCDPNYSGCLKPNAGDYDCAGGSGNGPNYTGRVQVLGVDEFGLDRDGDGWGCD